MSFQYMPLFVGDYLRSTRHLTPEEHGAYFLMLMHCWDVAGPLPLEERRLISIVNARTESEIGSMRSVLAEFFVRMNDGYYNARMMREIERSNMLSSKRAGAAAKRWEARGAIQAIQAQSNSKASVVQLHSNCIANGTTPSPSPDQTKPEKEKTKTTRAARASGSPAAPADVCPEVWADFLAIRAAARSPLTSTALAGIEREAKAAGMGLEAALRVCCERGWRGFKAAWVERDRSPSDAAAEAIRMIEEREARRAQG